MLQKLKKLVPRYLVNQYHHLLAWLGAVWYGWPGNKLVVIGVIGTSGKSTTVLLIAKILEEAGFKVGYTSTIGFKVDKKEWLNEHKVTMLGRFFNQQLLLRMVKAGCQYAIIESASQGVVQYRHVGINYDVMCFTNLHAEHIEAHGGFDKYRAAKGRLFRHLMRYKSKEIGKLKNWEIGNVETPRRENSEQQNKADTQENPDTSHQENGVSNLQVCDQKKYIPKQIVVNLDDRAAGYFADFPADKKYGYKIQGYKGTNNFQFPISNFQKDPKSQIPNNNIIEAIDVQLDGGGSRFLISNFQFLISLFGKYNVYNSLAAITVARALGVDLEICAKGLTKVKSIPGHMEEIENDQGFRVFVDYAFEPKALEKSYQVVKNLIKPRGKIIHVLGACGGGRDKVKRPVLGRMAAENADVVLVTNEDPYDDEPEDIIDQVMKGVVGNVKDIRYKDTKNFQFPISNKVVYKILDRREAIRKALELARERDLVFITGKGCEQFICVANGKKIKWDDRVVAGEELYKPA